MKHLLLNLLFGLAFTSTASLSIAGGVVSDLDDVSLRTALAGGGTVTFSSSGTVVLTNTMVIATDTVVDGAGQTVAISGNNAFRVFEVSPGVNFTLLNISVIQGRTNEGAAVFNDGGNVVASNCVFAGNMAIGAPGTNGINVASSGMPGSGGAIYSAGSLIVIDSAFSTNRAIGGDGGVVWQAYAFTQFGHGGEGRGAAIYASGIVGLTNCTFTANDTTGGDGGASIDASVSGAGNGAEAAGGAVYASGTLNASKSTFSSNACTGGDAGQGTGTGGGPARASGGALFCISNNATLVDCAFNANKVVGGYNRNSRAMPYRGAASGGAICSITSTVMIASCTVRSNNLSGAPVFGGGVYQQAGTMTISGSSITGNAAAADEVSNYYNFPGPPAWGGGFYSAGEALITDSIIATNQLEGGPAIMHVGEATAGPAYGAGFCSVGGATLYRCTLAGNVAIGGASHGEFAMQAGDAKGAGAYFATNAAALINCTIAGNSAQAGSRGLEDFGSAGSAFGGGLFTDRATTSLTNCTLAENETVAGRGWNGVAYGGNAAVQTGTIQVLNTILSAGVSSNAYGTITDLGHNISSDTSCSFSAPGSVNNSNPMLLPLANNGGFTPTMALLPDSPAIDSATAVTGVDVDQRGVTRPYGTAPDIGAYEWNATSFYTEFSLSIVRSNGNWTLPIVGPPMMTVRVQVSTNLTTWSDISTNSTGAKGTFTVEAPQTPGSAAFYRTVAP